MSIKRRDKKNRILRNGESQRSDGRYAYKYMNIDGKVKFVYSWKLVPTDSLSDGKRECVALRDLEKEIQKRLEQGVVTKQNKITLIEYFQKYIDSKTNIKDTTRNTYKIYLEILAKEDFGKKKISNVNQQEAKNFCIKLKKDGKKYNTIRTLKTFLFSVFKEAIEEGITLKNPFVFKISDVLQNDTKKREALTADEEECFLHYTKNSKYSKYYDGFYLLFNTGLRVSEMAGLTLSDIDFEKRTININHQLSYYNSTNHICSTKSISGVRIIPMTNDLYECLKRITDESREKSVKKEIDGISNFLFTTTHNNPTTAITWDYRFKTVCDAYNKSHSKKIPIITPHICRHTYCSKLIRKKIPIKIVQYLMGHSNVQVTLDIYSHITYDDVVSEMKKYE